MEADHVLTDLHSRLARGIDQIEKLRVQAEKARENADLADIPEGTRYWNAERHRLEGKRQGLELVKDWIRSYAPTPPAPKGEPVMRERVDSVFGPALILTYADGSTEKVFDPS